MQKKEEKKEESFFEKYKTDKKFNAKVQLIVYGAFIIILIIGLNLNSQNTTSSKNITSLKSETTNSRITNKRINPLEKINNNYEYEIKGTIIKKENEKKEISYTGKRYKNTKEIIKNNQIENTYYKINSRYYKKNNNEYESTKEEEIYDNLEKEYIELENIKEYIEASSLDHITEYSSGKKEYVYHMRVKEIIKNYPEIDEIEINVTEENNIITIKIDYISLMKVLDINIEECKVTYTYKNIGLVEDFTNIENLKEQDKEQ